MGVLTRRTAHVLQSNATGGAGSSQTSGAGSSSRADTPSSETGITMPPEQKKYRANSYAFIMIGTGGGNGSKDGTILLDCVNCQRQVRSVFASTAWIHVAQIASNRYAPHLASCMGLSSARRAPSARTSGSTSGKPKCV